jgi:hypothetical protein
LFITYLAIASTWPVEIAIVLFSDTSRGADSLGSHPRDEVELDRTSIAGNYNYLDLPTTYLYGNVTLAAAEPDSGRQATLGFNHAEA